MPFAVVGFVVDPPGLATARAAALVARIRGQLDIDARIGAIDARKRIESVQNQHKFCGRTKTI